MPVPFECKGNAPDHPEGRKQTPTIQKPCLTLREPHLFDGKQFLVMEDEPMNHVVSKSSAYSIAELASSTELADPVGKGLVTPRRRPPAKAGLASALAI